jgi:serine/threonine protein kinase
VDIWALGIVAYRLLSETLPFKAEDKEGLARAILEEEPSFELQSFTKRSAHAVDFVRQCLQKDPKKRPSVTTLLDHPWIQSREDEHD